MTRENDNERERKKGKEREGRGGETKGKREMRSERVREILRKCGGGGMPVECK